MNRPKTLSGAFVHKVRTPGRYGDGRGGHGVSLLVRATANGRVSKTWSQRLYIDGKPVMLGLGSYPVVTLADARAKALENRRTLARGSDPRTVRKMPTFTEATEQVIAMHAETWKPGSRTGAIWRRSLELYAYPVIGAKPVDEVTTADVMSVLVPIWSTKRATAQGVRQRIGIVMRWAVAQGLRPDNPAGEAVTAALPRAKARVKHHKALPYKEVAAALEVVRAAGAHWATRAAFEFMVLTATRKSEVRLMTWDEIDLDVATWTVPAERIKMGLAHRVPLSDRALVVLADAKRRTGGEGLVFPGRRGGPAGLTTSNRLLEDNGVAATPHGFRSSFKDWATECTDAPNEVSELALAHVNNDRTEAAYRRTDLYERRRQLMQQWADYLTD